MLGTFKATKSPVWMEQTEEEEGNRRGNQRGNRGPIHAEPLRPTFKDVGVY